MQCQKCGAPNDGGVFCTQCGARVSEAQKETNSPYGTPVSGSSPGTPPGYTPQQNASGTQGGFSPQYGQSQPQYGASGANQNNQGNFTPPNAQSMYGTQNAPMKLKQSGIGVAGFVVALVGIVSCYVPYLGIILCVVALALSIPALFAKDRSKGLSIAGVVIGAVGLILSIFMTIAIMNEVADIIDSYGSYGFFGGDFFDSFDYFSGGDSFDFGSLF